MFQDKAFLKTTFQMMALLALQNLITYSVNMVDNLMLGNYGQNELSGASIVNQIFFIIQQAAMAIGNGLCVLSAQYWGARNTRPIRTLTGTALKLAWICAFSFWLLCSLRPRLLLRIFSDNEVILDQGVQYLSLIRWTFPLFLSYTVLIAALRSVGTVKIAFYISIVSLGINVVLNYVLIFGNFGFPRLGVLGAAIATLIGRFCELGILLIYLAGKEQKLKLFSRQIFEKNAGLRRDYAKIVAPIMVSSVLWGVSVPMQTAILGHLSDDAIAANSVSTTFYQYLKVIVVAMASTSSVMIGNAIGKGDQEKVKKQARTLIILNVGMGVFLGLVLITARSPLLSFYKLTPEASAMAKNLMIVMALIMVGMSYQMPVSAGIMQGGGDAPFLMKLNLISTWLIVMPCSLLAAFVFRWPVEFVVLTVQSDQIFKGLPIYLRFRTYKWIRRLAKK